MRLIDADKLILSLNDYALLESPNENESTGEYRLSRIVYEAIQNCINAVEKQPTAYDIDKVVKKMEENSVIRANSKIFYDNPQKGEYVDFVVLLRKAIEIVKEGGKND